ncbi:enoyl-CoA hydratase/isomerase family protein [Streptomyces sp. CA-100214]
MTTSSTENARSLVGLSIDGDVATVTLDRPEVRNALSRQTHHALGRALSEAEASGARFVVLRGGHDVFSAGGDLAELGDGLPVNYVADYWERMRGTVIRMRAMSPVVVSVIEGDAIGAGAALALAADLVIATERARLSWSFLRLGLMPDAGVSYLLPRVVGPARARELLFTCRLMDAAEAHSAGLVNRLCLAEDVEATLAELLGSMRPTPPESVALAKHLLDAGTDFAGTVAQEGVYQMAAAAGTPYQDRIHQLQQRLRRNTPGQTATPLKEN